MNDDSNIELFKTQIRLKEQLAAIPIRARERFIVMLCERLGLQTADAKKQLAEKLASIFDALDAERN